MGDRETLEKIYSIMRGLFLVRMDGINPSPVKGTTKKECYRALYEIQELLGTRRIYFSPTRETNADRIRSMTDADLARFIAVQVDCGHCSLWRCTSDCKTDMAHCIEQWLAFLNETWHVKGIETLTDEEAKAFDKGWRDRSPDPVPEITDDEYTGDMFDAGDWTEKELRKRFPRNFEVLNEIRKRSWEADPEYYRNAIAQDKKEKEENQCQTQ